MRDKKFTRRFFIKGTGLAMTALSGFRVTACYAAASTYFAHLEVPCSEGTQSPISKVPANACDCHHHIYDPARFPYSPDDKRNQPPGTVASYRQLQKRLGTTRNVIIQPSAYGTDNSCTLDALQQMGSNSRAVVVIEDTVSDGDLRQMHELGVRGIRINLASELKATNFAMIEPLANRIKEFGWHVQFWLTANQIVSIEDLLLRLPAPIVFDHLGHIPQPAGSDHPAFRVISNLIDKGKTWVKLSGAYQDSKDGSPRYDDVTKLAKAYVSLAPERMVWGSDWPHPTIYSRQNPWPDDALLLDLLSIWAPDEIIRHKILVENPAILYDFSK